MRLFFCAQVTFYGWACRLPLGGRLLTPVRQPARPARHTWRCGGRDLIPLLGDMLMSNLSVFSFEKSPVRTILVSGAPWFSSADVGKILQLSNIRASVALLDDDEKGVNPKSSAIEPRKPSWLWLIKCRAASGTVGRASRTRCSSASFPAASSRRSSSRSQTTRGLESGTWPQAIS